MKYNRTISKYAALMVGTFSLVGSSVCSAEDVSVTDEHGPALVLIRVRSTHDQGRIIRGYGTGWLLTYDGYVLTAAHVANAGKKIPLENVILRGEIRGSSYPLELTKYIDDEEDIALLKFQWNTKQRAEKIVKDFYLESLGGSTQIVLVGFVGGDDASPSSFTSRVSQDGDRRLLSDGKIPAGLSGSPAFWITNNRSYLVGMARSEIVNDERNAIQGVLIPTRVLWRMIEQARNIGDLHEPTPTWLPERFPGLFRSEDIDRIIELLGQNKSVLLTGAPGMEVHELAVEVGYRLWREWNLLPSSILHVRMTDSKGQRDIESVLTDLLEQLGKGYLRTDSLETKRHQVRKSVVDASVRRFVILEAADDPQILSSVLRLLEQTPVLATSTIRSLTSRELRSHYLVGLKMQDCQSLLTHEAGKPAQNSDDESSRKTICELFGGTPAAIRIFGRLLRDGFTPRELVEELEANPPENWPNFDYLTRAYNRSIERLSVGDRKLLEATSLIGGRSFTTKAAAAAVGRPDIRFSLKNLENRNLLKRTGERYGMDFLIRALVQDDIAPDNRQTFQNNLVRHFLSGAPPADGDWENIVSILQDCLDSNSLALRDRCRQWSAPYLPLLRERGMWNLHQDVAVLMYEQSKSAGNYVGQGAALNARAEIELRKGREEAARKLLDEAEEIANKLDAEQRARTRFLLSWWYSNRADRDEDPAQKNVDVEKAIKHATEGLELSKLVKSPEKANELRAQGPHHRFRERALR